MGAKMNNFWKKKYAILTALLVVVFLGGFMAFGNPFKVTDPSDPRFNPDKFSFSDYKSREELADAFRVLFPVGTPKEFVDRVLIKAVVGEPTQDKNLKNVWFYWENLPFSTPNKSIQHIFIFDAELRVLNIIPSASVEIYPDQLKLKDLNDSYEKELKEKQLKEKDNGR
jgi:hypothetical protein